MPYYEKEVLSISAGDTYELINEYLIYSFPSDRTNHREHIFITFRKKEGGEMENLYKIQHKLEFNYNNPEDLENIKNSGFDYIDRLLNYIEGIKLIYPKSDHKSKYYILNLNDIIKLEDKPKPRVNNTGSWYYKISEFMSGNEIINVDND
jgi:hypothetical protein